jgi:SAM-dependent methyltransferase
MHCNVCGSSLSNPIYQSQDNRSITTMNTLIEGQTSVYFCGFCGHLQTNELPDLVKYYAQEYDINSASEDDDQLYKVVDGTPIYRADHQAATLMSKVGLSAGLRVLDYGCAKGATLKKAVAAHEEIIPFLFDVTDRYIPFWEKFPAGTSWATHNPDPLWRGSMDIVLSLYALEHIADLRQAVTNIRQLLKPGGIFYFIVPNVYENTADFIVADHINHFSRNSIISLLSAYGFVDIDVDERVHDSAFVVTGVLDEARPKRALDSKGLDELLVQAQSMAGYWSGISSRIGQYEESLGDAPLAIYGAGFYGNFLVSSLRNPARVKYFVDQNAHLQGTTVNGRPVLSPAGLPAEVTHVLVGLNPRSAKSAISSIGSWRARSLSYFFL